MTTELTRCSNSKRSTTDSPSISSNTDQTKPRLTLSPTSGKEFFRFPQRQRRKSSEKDEVGERSFPSMALSNDPAATVTKSGTESCQISSPSNQKQRKISTEDIKPAAVISKRLKRAFSVNQESGGFENQNNAKYSPKQKGLKNPEKIKCESKVSLVKFGPVQLPNPNTTGEFFKQRASFHSDTSTSCAAGTSSPSTSGLGEQDTGIICSNSDLRSILSDATTSKKAPVDIKRERMKNYRSLSFDSSVFRLPRRGSSMETPVWFSWNKSAARIQETGENKQEEERKNIIQIRLTSESPEDDVLESSASGSECSPKKSNKVQVVVEDVKAIKSGIPWDERSVVDVNVLGNAIESYLGERRASGDETVKPNDENIQDVSLCSSLKSMFVK